MSSSSRFLAFLLLTLLSPILLLTSLLILLLSHTFPLFTQPRIGLRRKPFTIIKFKTMVGGRVTRFGSILRATGIDELPQLWNIIKGDMQFIGPRPLTQKDVDRLKWNSSKYDKRFSVRPGMTGFAQLSPICDPKNTLTQDHKTIDEKSAFNVLKILFFSIAIAFFGKKIIKKFL